MDEKRRGIIAYEILRYRVMREQMKIASDMTSRSLGNIAKETGLPLEELKQFARELINDVLEEALE